MAYWIERTKRAVVVTFVIGIVGCSDLPSKNDSLEIVKKEVKEEASCVLPAPIFTTLKMQLVTKAACVPKEGAAEVLTCVNGLINAGLVTPMPASYMLEWPDDVAAKSLSELPAFERRARKDLYSLCFGTTSDMREGRFKCGDAAAERVIKVSKVDATHADVRYARTLTLDPKLSDLDRACGAITRPPVEMTVRLEKSDKGIWSLPPPDVAYH